MYKSINEFLGDWKSESGFTLKIFSSIPDDQIDIKEKENIRSLGRLAWHITQTLTEMPHKAGLLKTDTLDDQPVPKRMKEIIEIYTQNSENLIQVIRDNWTDAQLEQTITLYGQEWTKAKVLSVMIKHQIHHRAQMTVLMRLKNIPVPGIYGPSREEWTAFGMKPQE